MGRGDPWWRWVPRVRSPRPGEPRALTSTVLLHPSLGRPASDFDDLVDRLDHAGFTCLRVDPKVPGPDATLHDLAADAAAVLDATGVERAHLIGHALGNRVMRCLAVDRPERVASVSLLAAGGRTEGDDEARAALISCFDTGLDDEAHLGAIRTAFFAPGNAVPPEWRTGWDPVLAGGQGSAVGRTDASSWWDGGNAPMLIVQGLQDRIAPPANGRQLSDQRGAQLVELARAGHALLPEHPAEVAAAVVGFCLAMGSS